MIFPDLNTDDCTADRRGSGYYRPEKWPPCIVKKRPQNRKRRSGIKQPPTPQPNKGAEFCHGFFSCWGDSLGMCL